MASGASRIIDWILTLGDEDDQAIRAFLLRTLVDDDLLSIAGLFWTLFCWIMALAVTGWVWLVVPMAVDLLFFAVRWRIRRLPTSVDESELGAVDRLAALVNILWISLIAIEVVILVQAPSLRAVVLGVVLSIGFLGYVSSLYAAFPRLAALNIALLTTGLAIGLASSDFSDLHIIAFLMPCGGFAYLVLMRRMHRSLVDAVRAQHQNRQRALHDPLTGLPNRVLMLDRLDRYCARSRDANRTEHVGVLFLDLDGFKGINDRHGHAAGDMVLVHVANLLRAAVRKEDTVSRLGGDEYVVLLPGLGESAINAIAERIIAATAQPMEIGLAAPVRVGVSIGIAHGYQNMTTPEELLSRADGALYRAKRSGKGRFAFAA